MRTTIPKTHTRKAIVTDEAFRTVGEVTLSIGQVARHEGSEAVKATEVLTPDQMEALHLNEDDFIHIRS